MKRRAFKVLNFFAFNLLFFALYLNFIHKDQNVQEAIQTAPAATGSNTVLVQNVHETNSGLKSVKHHSMAEKTNGGALKPSFN